MLTRIRSNGEKVSAKAHGGPIDIEGVTVAHLSDKLQVTKLETWFDPIEMFRQIAPEGIVRKDVAAAAAAAGCPVAGHSKAFKDETSAQDVIREPEQHAIAVNSAEADSRSDVQDDMALDAARKAEKAVVDEKAKLGSRTTASEANTENGKIPRANAE